MNWTTILKREYSLKDILLAHEDIYYEYPKYEQYVETSKIKIIRDAAFMEFVKAYLSGNKLSTKLRMSLKKLASNRKLEMRYSTLLSNLSITGRVKPFPFKVSDYELTMQKGGPASVILILISKNDVKIYLYRLVVGFNHGCAVASWQGNMLFIGNKFEDLGKLINEIIGINTLSRRVNQTGYLNINIKTRYVDDKGQAYITDSMSRGKHTSSVRNPIYNYQDDFNGYVEEIRDFWDKKLKQVSSENLTPLKTNPGVSE
tara:strand:- start:465 stop:1241 length:777 start_codon:yes stop_codon:yes gene_type:complete